MASFPSSYIEIVCRLILGACSIGLVFGTLLPLHHSNAWWGS
jgi:hypothetical protein